MAPTMPAPSTLCAAWARGPAALPSSTRLPRARRSRRWRARASVACGSILKPIPRGRFEPADAKAVLDATAEQIRGLGWHVQIYTRTAVVAGLKDHLARMPLPVVVDHFGRGNPAQGPGHPDFAALLELVKSGHLYVKISGAYRVSERAPDFSDVVGLAQALVAANPDRIVWGSDWPHPNSDAGRGKPLAEISAPFPIDDGLLLNQLPKWVPDPAVRKKILVDNPARLYGFAPVAG